jgi:hypothetical protein
MNKVAIDNKQFQEKVIQIYKEEETKILQEKWDGLTKNEKIFVLEFLRSNNKIKKGVISEAKWYNTIGDIVGVFDPTGLVDAVNAVSYFKQGDTLFGIMSLISVIPYVGDAFAKPIVGVLKSGKGLSSTLRGAVKPSQWVALGKRYPIIGGLLKKIPEIGNQLVKIIEAVPLGKKFTGVVKKWVGTDGIFTQASKGLRGGAKMTAQAGGLTQKSFSLFRNYGIDPRWGFFKRMWKRGGILKNRQASRLLRDTKWWLGFLDYAGIGNFVGPEELSASMGDEKLNEKMEAYMNSPEAQDNWESEMNKFQDQDQDQGTTSTQPKQDGGLMDDPLLKLFFPTA